MSPSAISKWLFRSKHAVTSLLHTLEAQGAINEELSIWDQRVKYIKLTEEGRKAVEEVMPTVRMIVESVFSCLDHEEVETLNGILRRLRKQLYKQIDDYMASKAERLP